MSDKPIHYYGQLKPKAIQCQELSQSTAWMVSFSEVMQQLWLAVHHAACQCDAEGTRLTQDTSLTPGRSTFNDYD